MKVTLESVPEVKVGCYAPVCIQSEISHKYKVVRKFKIQYPMSPVYQDTSLGNTLHSALFAVIGCTLLSSAVTVTSTAV